MTNTDFNENDPLPFNHNITIAQAIMVLATAGTLFGVNLDPATAKLVVMAAVSVFAVVTWVMHTFVNHPANIAKAKSLMRAAELKGRRIVQVFLIFVLMGTMLMGCATNGQTNYAQILNGAQLAFNSALTIYNQVCDVQPDASFCSPADRVTAATLEKAVSDAIALAQVAIKANGGQLFTSADVDTAITKVEDAVIAFENFVNQLHAAKSAKVAAKYRALEARP